MCIIGRAKRAHPLIRSMEIELHTYTWAFYTRGRINIMHACARIIKSMRASKSLSNKKFSDLLASVYYIYADGYHLHYTMVLTEEQKLKRNARRREKRAEESKEEKEERLRIRNAKDRARRAEKKEREKYNGELQVRIPTEEEEEERLRKRNERDRERRALKRASTELEVQNEKTLPRQKRVRLTLTSAGLPVLEDSHVQDTMQKFHLEMSVIEAVACTTCLEKFPGTKHNSNSECQRCARDKHVPKLFSFANNMHPGGKPTELQVRQSL